MLIMHLITTESVLNCSLSTRCMDVPRIILAISGNVQVKLSRVRHKGVRGSENVTPLIPNLGTQSL